MNIKNIYWKINNSPQTPETALSKAAFPLRFSIRLHEPLFLFLHENVRLAAMKKASVSR